MFVTRLYKYDSDQEANGYKGEDFSRYVLQGATYTEDITQELDTQEITLNGLPFSKEFDPETKFIAEIVEVLEDQEIIWETLHLCVARDMVSQPILSDNEYFDHHISFIEPSVVAQKRLVDNISATYKLKDVSLEQQVAYPIDQTPDFINQSSALPAIYNFGVEKYQYFFDIQYTRHFKKYFEYEGEIGIYNPDTPNTLIDKRYIDVTDLKDITTNPSDPTYQALIKVPKLAIWCGVKNSMDYAKIGYASLDLKVDEYNVGDQNNITNSWNFPFISNSNLDNSNAYVPYLNDYYEIGKPTFLREWLFEDGSDKLGYEMEVLRFAYKKYTDISANAPTYEALIEIKPDKEYKFTVCLHEFPDDQPIAHISGQQYAYVKYTGDQPNLRVEWDLHYLTPGLTLISYNSISRTASTSIQTNGITTYTTYLNDPLQIYYASSTPYSALALLQKAIVNSCICEKIDGVYCADVNNSNLAFYIDPNYVTKLSGTAIIENFYNQKNLWEIALEVGHYIYAIPELKFGSNDRFMFTFNELGRTDQKSDNSPKINIFNSRSVEDYICATSSYLANMVQLGGYIEEWVAPKTTNETLLISNDTADILTTKPIIELLSITIKNTTNDAEADFTPFVFEKNVYDTLGVDFTLSPNRGNSLYYELGKNAILGGDFQLPTTNTGDPQNDYTIKKAIYMAYNGYSASNSLPSAWNNIQVSDYVFKIRYRTKDEARMSHARPDLRKYLLNSNHDRFPQHNQFNNQQDILLDSIKFGNNLYGKLIKTGNTSYMIDEWNSSFANIKHKGELYHIGADLYYVSKATHEIQSNCIISKVEYSKDYNELSAVIGIPSEPRFYEISEQSQIRREVAINDILYVTDKQSDLQYNNNYVLTYYHLRELIFDENTKFLQYALTVFKGDKDTNKYDQTVGESDFYRETFVPINAYSSANTLTYEWDMIDNYSAGDKVISTDKAHYNSLRAVQYTDVYGKSALMDFFLLGESELLQKIELDNNQIKALPESPFKTKITDPEDTRTSVYDLTNNIFVSNVKDTSDTDYNGRGICLLKDCREAISINYNLQLATSSDTFVISPFVFTPDKKNIRIVLLSEEVNKLTDGYVNISTFIKPLDTDGEEMNNVFVAQVGAEYGNNSGWGTFPTKNFYVNLQSALSQVNAKHFTGEDGFMRIKAIAVVYNVYIDNNGDVKNSIEGIDGRVQFIMARNIPETFNQSQAMDNWYFGAPKKNIFKNKQ